MKRSPTATSHLLSATRSQLAVDSGTRGTVWAVDPDRLGVTIQTDDGRLRELPAGYVAEHLEHAYALTGHGSQGATVERAQVIGTPEDFTNEWAYTALSRARNPVTVHLIAQPTDRSHQAGRLERLVEVDHRERGHWFDRHGDELIEFAAAKLELHHRDDQARERRINNIRRDQPDWITNRLGRRPDVPTARTHWDRAAAHLDDYRQVFGTLPAEQAPALRDYRQRHAWEQVHSSAAKALDSTPNGRQSSAHRPRSTATSGSTSAVDETRSCLQPLGCDIG
jgi:hypothetical protein